MRITSAVLAVLFSPLAASQVPLVDDGFAPATPLPDADLVVVREMAYGAGGVDLSPYIPGAGVEDYVQSIYFRFFTDTANPTVIAFNGVVVFPFGTRIIGFVTDSAGLGGAVDDGVFTATDAVFGTTVTANPDDYSEDARGFETAPTTEEFICEVEDNAFVFLLSITGGVDDFRVIVDYGDAWPTNAAFSIDTFGGISLGAGVPHAGIRVGNDLNPVVLGSGDWGEIGSLSAIPITSAVPPVPGDALELRPLDILYMTRDTGGDSAIDGFQVPRRFPVPSRFSFAYPGGPIGLTGGPDGFLYALGGGAGFSVSDTVSGNTLEYVIEDRAGANTALCDMPGTRDLFFVRDTSGDTFVDRFDVDTNLITETFTISSSDLGTPAAIEAAGGMLYVLGQGGSFVELDPMTGATVRTVLAVSGAYTGMTRSASGTELLLVRDNPGDTAVDRYDPATGMPTFDWASFPGPGTPVDIEIGPLGYVYVLGIGSTASAGLIGLDPVTGTEALYTECLDFPGNNTGIAYTTPGLGENYCGPAVATSTGEPAWISAHGSAAAGGNPLEVAAWSLPPNQFGYFITGQTEGFITCPGGSKGNLCIVGTIGRFVQQVQNSGALGRLRIDVDTLALPVSPTAAAQAGETWHFQAWFRDNNPGQTSNFTDAVSVTFN